MNPQKSLSFPVNFSVFYSTTDFSYFYRRLSQAWPLWRHTSDVLHPVTEMLLLRPCFHLKEILSEIPQPRRTPQIQLSPFSLRRAFSYPAESRINLP